MKKNEKNRILQLEKVYFLYCSFFGYSFGFVELEKVLL
jgi:hypothetical protein